MQFSFKLSLTRRTHNNNRKRDKGKRFIGSNNNERIPKNLTRAPSKEDITITVKEEDKGQNPEDFGFFSFICRIYSFYWFYFRRFVFIRFIGLLAERKSRARGFGRFRGAPAALPNCQKRTGFCYADGIPSLRYASRSTRSPWS